MQILPLALIGFAILYLTKGTSVAAAVKQLQFLNPKIKFGSVSFTSIAATITMDVHNPTAADVPVDYLSGHVGYKGKNLAAFRVDGKATNLAIKAHATTPVKFDISISNFNAIATIVDIIGNGVSTVLQVSGIFYAMGTDANFSFSYDVVKQQPVAISGTTGKVGFNGIAGVEAKLNFSSNAEMEKYFSGKRAQKKMLFSKN